MLHVWPFGEDSDARFAGMSCVTDDVDISEVEGVHFSVRLASKTSLSPLVMKLDSLLITRFVLGNLMNFQPFRNYSSLPDAFYAYNLFLCHI